MGQGDFAACRNGDRTALEDEAGASVAALHHRLGRAGRGQGIGAGEWGGSGTKF